MVDGLNITSPRLPGTGDIRNTVSKTAAESRNTREAQSTEVAREPAGNETNKVSSAIAKSAEERFSVLSAGNVKGFLQAAEKYIDAALPSKPPGTKLRIDLDADTGRFVYQGVDINTGDVVTQFPSEQILKLIAFNRERDGVEGIVVDEEA